MLFCIILKLMKLKNIISLLFLVVLSLAATARPLEAVGTVLPQLKTNTPARIFNDLMKQSMDLVPWTIFSWGGIGRCWGCTLTQIGGLKHQYPSGLPDRVWAVAEIPFFQGIDEGLQNQVYNIRYSGKGTVGVYQQGYYNTTWTSGAGGNFTLKTVSTSLFVYIYLTDPTDPVNSITILPDSLGPNPPTYTTNFLSYLKPFNLFRTCSWQGQNLYNSGTSLQIWANRTQVSSSSQVTSSGAALEHILELEQVTGATLWPCIPDSADTNYIQQMASLISSSRDKSKMMYLQFGNVYTLMNDIPDRKTTPAFDTFMTTYGSGYRSSVLFTINYKVLQYYINAMGMRKSPPVNYTYIDCIGYEDINFGLLNIQDTKDLDDGQIKELLVHYMLQNETTVNKAYQLAKRNGTELITVSGGPYIKTKRYDYIWKNKSNSSYQEQAARELALANRLNSITLNDEWVGEFNLLWLARLKSMGVKSVVIGQLWSGAFTYDTDVIGIVPFLNKTTPLFRALSDYKFNNRQTTLTTFGTVPSNPSICSPQCVWGDCILNACACFAGYSGEDCSIYTAPAQQNKIGVNLQGLSYWTTQTPFVDLHRQGSDWVYFVINQGWSSGDAFKSDVTFDANGYPTYLPPGIAVGTLMARDIVTHYDSGKYTILYDGDGVLTFGMYDVLSVKYGVGKCIVEVLPSTNMNNGLLITIERTNPDNHIRNIRVIRPGFENTWWTQVYSPLMLEKLAPYGTLRFMDWTNTNGQTDKVWFDRVKVSHRAYTKNGVAWEEVIHLANLMGKNVWINIPHLANEDYIIQLANLFLHTLEPHLHVYVEYSNEVWGTLFPGGQYAQQEGVKYYSDPSKITPLNNATDPTQARFCYLSMITQKISDIWKAVWSQPSDKARLHIVVSTQAVNADTTRRILSCQNGYKKFDAVAIAPYLSVQLADTMSQADVLTKLNQALPALAAKIQQHLAFATQYNLPLTCYQAGQGLLGQSTVTNQLQIGVQTDDTMRSLYKSYFTTLFDNSIQLVNHYTDTSAFSKYGSWGMYQYADQKLSVSSKWKGTLEYLTENNLPVSTQSFGACDKNCNGNGFCNFGRCVCYNGFSGDDCSQSKFIDFVQCGYLCTFNQGVCQFKEIIGINRYFQCSCYPGYIGAYCGIPQCAGECSYNGECTAANTCKCFRGKMGAKCEVDCGCGGHGTCNSDGTCLCDEGYLFNSTSKKCQFSCLGQPSSNCIGPNLLACSSGCEKGTCNNGTCQCWPGFSGSSCATEVDIAFKTQMLGVNVGGLSYWSTQHLFKDYNKQSSQWIPLYYPNYFNSSIQYTWDTKTYFPTQINGNPASLYANQSVGKLLLRDIQLRYPQINQTNEYVLLYDGDGVLKLSMDATPYEVSAGRIRFTVKPSTVRDNGVFVNLIKTNPSNPVRNIRVVLAKDQYNYKKDLLTEDFITFISEFSTIRFMDLLRTNGNPVSSWNQTTPYDYHSQAVTSGISIQLLTEIVTRTGRNAWINVPHQATDDYVTKLATYLKANLPQKRKIYVEYSNEVWNTFFDQGKYAVAQSTALGLANYHKFYAKRSKEIFNIFKSVFGDSASSVLKFVVSYQAVSQWVADQIFNGTGLVGLADIVAAGPYFDCDNIGNVTNTAYYATQTPGAVIDKCKSSLGTLDAMFSIESTIATTYNVKKATYESGTSISETNTIYNGGENPAATANFIAANRDANMYDVYKNLLNKYKSSGLGTEAPLMLFSSVGLPSKYGSWGLLDYMDQVRETPTHPKFQAVIDFNKGQ